MDCVDLQGTANPQAQHERKRYFPRALHPFENYGLVQQTVQIVVRSSHNLTLFVMRHYSLWRQNTVTPLPGREPRASLVRLGKE